MKVYYEHYGDIQRGYAGAPEGWYTKSYAWLPYALHYHHMYKYLEYIEELEPTSWAKNFYQTHSSVYDDDIYDNPPDDWFMSEDETGLMDAYEKDYRRKQVVG